MKKFIGYVNKTQMGELMVLTRRLNGLEDLKSTLLDSEREPHPQEDSTIDLKMVEIEIAALLEKQKQKREEIRGRQGWSLEEMSRIQLLENGKAFIKPE